MKKVIFIFAIRLVAIFCLDFLFLNQSSRAVSPYRPDDQIGWIPKENFHRSFKQKDLDGNEYDVQFFSYTDGFRAYGDIDSNKVKMRKKKNAQSDMQMVDISISWATKLPARSWLHNLRITLGIDDQVPDRDNILRIHGV
jgi:hypothetical protein